MSTRTYYGGHSAFDGKIHPLKATSFKDLVDRYFNMPVPIQITRAEFHAKPIEEQKRIKDGPFITPCVFKEGETSRNDANAESLVLLFLDIDPAEGDERYVHDLFSAPEVVAEQLHPFNFVMYTTASHTDANPRLKICVELSQMPLECRYAGVAHLCHVIGLPRDFKGARESKVASQPQYRPVTFIGDEHSAILCSRTHGRAMDQLDIPAETVNEEDRRYAYQGNSDETSIAYLPIVDLKPEDIREPLYAISPDCGYRVWTEVASALRHQFRDEEEAEEAYFMFDEWSSGGEKYVSGEDTFGKWRSFKPDATGKTPITIRSVFHYASQEGWKPSVLLTKVKTNIAEWIAKCEDPNELLEQGAARIAAMPFKNELVEEDLVLTLQARIKALSGKTLEKTTIRKQIRDTRFIKRREEQSDVPGWLRPMCFVAPRNEFHNVTTGIIYSPAAFDNTFSRFLMPKDDTDLAKTGKPLVLPTSFALNVLKIRTVDGITYDPRQGGAEPFFSYKGLEYLNRYRLSSVPAEDPENAEKAGKWFRKLLKTVIDDAEYERTILDFCAYCIQYPGEKIRWAPLLQSAQGAGKSTIFEILGAAMGEENMMIVNSSAMASSFNDWRGNNQFTLFEEIMTPGHNRGEVANSVKDAITNTRVTLNQKFKDVVVIENVTNYAALTNHHNGLFVEDSDRRYMPIKSPLQTKEQVMALTGTGFFEHIYAIKNRAPGAFRSFFLAHKISADFPVNGPAPFTRFRKELIDDSKNQVQLEIEDLIEGGDLLIGDDVIHYNHLVNKVVRTHQNAHRPSHYLQLLGYMPYMEGVKFMIEGERTPIWVHRVNYDTDFGLAENILRERFSLNSDFED